MLTAYQIDVLRDRSEQLLDPVIDFLIEDIAQRVSAAGQLTGTASYQVRQAQKLGISQNQLKKEIQKRLKVSKATVEKLLTQAAEAGYNFDISRFPTKKAIPFAANSTIQQILNATAQLAKDDLTNMTQTIGFVGTDGVCRELTAAYNQACDFAFQKVSTGAQDFHSVVREATRNLAQKGIQYIDYETGVHTSLDAAVRRNIMGGLGLMQEKISQQNHDDLGCDGWEISAHAGSAPDHEPYQGKQYSDAEYERLNNSLVRRISTLNCGHVKSPIIMGVTDPQYTPEELEQFRQDNETGATYDGKHYTLYEATQRQRKLERSIRNRKRRILIDETLNDKDQMQTDQIKLVTLRQEYKRFSKAAGLPMQHEREELAGFTWKKGKAAEDVARDPFKNPPKDLKQLSKQIDKKLNQYSERESKWSGTTIVQPRDTMIGVKGRKEWNCDITLREDAGIKTVIHEHLHARSVSYYDSKMYVKYRNLEEGTVELYAQEICKLNNIPYSESYPEQVQPLRIINNILRNGDRYSFSKQLFDIPLPERYNWLEVQVDQLIFTNKLSKKTEKSLCEALRKLQGEEVQ